ncbi:MAG TPA: AMP-binding protein [Acidobacteriota bacterium]|nr:AMP-binding protein [Acidobacteriota bacterium]
MKNPPLLPSYPLHDLRELVFKAAQRKPDKAALKSKTKGVWTSTTYAQLREQVEHMATFYFECGLKAGERIGILSENRTEWCIAYLAAVASGMTALPIDKDLKPREVRHILKFAEAALLVCGGEFAAALEDVRGDIETLEKVVSMEEEKGVADLSFPEALEIGYQALEEGSQAFAQAQVSPDDVAAIIFTSGTTGNPKGVMLTHGNIAADIKATSEYVSIAGEEDVLLSVLPLHHTYECTGGFLMVLYQGSTVCHAENLRRIAENMAETRTTIMLGVPLLFEMIYRRIEEGLRKKGEGKIRTAKKVASFTERFLGWNIRRRLFKELHQRFGGKLRLLISGGAAIDPAVSKGFRELGIDFIQGYGMTEAAPIVAVNRVNCFRDAAAGIPLPGVEVKIEKGEICVRGDIVMKGYYRNPEATAETIIDGWLHTGDLGYLEDGFVYINGRKKSVIVTPNGKNVYPEELETALNQSPYILESLVWGGPEEDPSQVEVQAIVVPDSEGFDQEFGASSYDDDKVQQVISAEIKRICMDMANYKKIKKFTLRQEEFEKTTTKKIKRFLYTGRPQAVATEGAKR